MRHLFEKIKTALSEKLSLYPVLTGLLFLVNELRKNAPFFTAKEIILLILIILAFTVGVDYLSKRWIKNRMKAALVATFFILINLFYQDIYLTVAAQTHLFKLINSATSNHPEVILLPVLFLGWVLFTFFILRAKQISSEINVYLNVIFLLFIGVELVKAAAVPIPKITLADNTPFPVNTSLTDDQKPDIYYIILDAYTSSASLKKYWGYNNSTFEDSLINLGFKISSDSKTEYTSTPYCIAAYLNSSPLVLDTSKYKYNERNLIQLIWDNRLYPWLKANNYHCFNLSLFDAFGSNKFYSFFTNNHYLGRTIWYVNFIKLYHYINPKSNISQTNLKVFEQIKLISERETNKTKFLYAHVMMPHVPYVFNHEGKPLKKNDKLTDKQKYLEQLRFTNHLTFSTIKEIIQSFPRKKIIIIQGDHGYRNLENTIKSEIKSEAHSLFLAFYSNELSLIPDSINPVKNFNNIVNAINNRKPVQ